MIVELTQNFHGALEAPAGVDSETSARMIWFYRVSVGVARSKRGGDSDNDLVVPCFGARVVVSFRLFESEVAGLDGC
jgi:hypothetical protein